MARSPRLRAAVRAGAYVVLLIAVTSTLLARRASANFSERALDVGRQLAKLEQFTASATRLELNGQPVNVASASLKADLAEVLTRFEAVCHEDGVVARDLADLGGVIADDSLTRAARERNFGVLRAERGDEGVVACLVRSPNQAPGGLASRLHRFSETLDLADVGHLRYLFARRTPEGRVLAITVWTDGALRIDALAGAKDFVDAPGRDPEGMPRPPESRRLLSASAERAPHGLFVYESRASADAVLASYQQQLPALGWRAIPVDGVAEARVFSNGRVDLLVMAWPAAGGAQISILQTEGN
ncbi:MAG: hypothetical protein KF718_25230 [Polyangiaceae bacterium]|nr:hypothetical protein [Polyangiaceae bacterium]